MKIFPAEAVKEIDAYTITHEPIESIDLMERAAGKLAAWIMQNTSPDTPVSIFVGPGNNGGDGLALSRILCDHSYCVSVFILNFTDKRSNDFITNQKRLIEQNKARIKEINNASGLNQENISGIIVDGIFGSGLTRPAKGLPADIIRILNKTNSYKIAIDIPSGLFGENNNSNIPENIFQADVTLTFQFPFL